MKPSASDGEPGRKPKPKSSYWKPRPDGITGRKPLNYSLRDFRLGLFPPQSKVRRPYRRHTGVRSPSDGTKNLTRRGWADGTVKVSEMYVRPGTGGTLGTFTRQTPGGN